jgi:membrane associated rhomboid family serine protease
VNTTAYLAHVQERLGAIGFADFAVPTDLQQRIPLAVQRAERWGRLTIALVAPKEAAEAKGHEALISAVGAWTRGARKSDGPHYLLLVFPFDRKVDEKVSSRLMGLRIGEQERWGVIPWVADLAVGLIDRHTGFPKVDDQLAVILAEVPRTVVEAQWERVTGPKVGRRFRFLPDLGHVPATRIILALTIAVFIGDLVLGMSGGGNLLASSGGGLIGWFANNGRQVIINHQHWRLLTHLLLHAGILHLLFNMWALWNLGRHVELLYGSWRFTLIYLFAGVAGGLSSVMFRAGFTTSLGASGAIMGLLGALLYFAVAFPGRSIPWRQLMGPIGFNLLFGFFIAGIDNYAHVGGFIGGILAAFVIGVAGQRSGWRRLGMASLVLFLMVVLSGLVPIPHLIQ